MPSASSPRYLSLALTVFGLIFLIGIYPLTRLWPSGWSWTPVQPAYLQMILGIYATLGVFLLLAARDPLRHRSLIWFTVWSSVVHAGIMAYHAFQDPTQRGHLGGGRGGLAARGAGPGDPDAAKYECGAGLTRGCRSRGPERGPRAHRSFEIVSLNPSGSVSANPSGPQGMACTSSSSVIPAAFA